MTSKQPLRPDKPGYRLDAEVSEAKRKWYRTFCAEVYNLCVLERKTRGRSQSHRTRGKTELKIVTAIHDSHLARHSSTLFSPVNDDTYFLTTTPCGNDNVQVRILQPPQQTDQLPFQSYYCSLPSFDFFLLNVNACSLMHRDKNETKFS